MDHRILLSYQPTIILGVTSFLFGMEWSGCNSLEAARLDPYSQWLVDSWIPSPPLRVKLLGE